MNKLKIQLKETRTTREIKETGFPFIEGRHSSKSIHSSYLMGFNLFTVIELILFTVVSQTIPTQFDPLCTINSFWRIHFSKPNPFQNESEKREHKKGQEKTENQINLIQLQRFNFRRIKTFDASCLQQQI